MPQDPNLYGQPPPKRQKKQIDLSSSLAFTSQVTALLSGPSTTASSSATTSGRARPSRTKPDIFAGAKAKRKSKASSSSSGPGGSEAGSGRLNLREPLGTEDDRAASARARRKMEEKARLYAAMKRGDYIAKEGEVAPLVDFDRKWAEAHEGNTAGGGGGESSSGSDNESDSDDGGNNNDNEIIEFEDEFGRLRRGTAAEKQRLARRLARGTTAASELERMSARPKAPEGVIYGDAVQSEAFAAADEERMEEIAAKRDRSVTPPPAEHYRANWEIRTKGVGFYAFSSEEGAREAEMSALKEERARTEASRREREEKLAARKREIEERRREIGEKRAKKMADSFLDGLGMDLAGGDSGKNATATATADTAPRDAETGRHTESTGNNSTAKVVEGQSPPS